MSLAARDVISERYRPLAHVYFPLSGMASLVITMRDGSTVEMATIGREGMVGVPMMSRSRATAAADAIVQVAGEVLRMRITAFHSLLEETRRLPVLVARFSEALFQLVAQSAACNRLHPTDQRLSRWLLMTQDRLESVELPLTHEFLGQMLGVRRQSVSEAAEELQGRGLIHYHRGHMSVLDRPGLEAITCECYEVMRGIFDGLYD
jgi:CRP-like cAMP-binding protein